MGVKQLWNILEPVKETKTSSALSNKTLCVDLSFWICEAHGTKGLGQTSKPHLTNLFWRCRNLTREGVKLVFVLDGKPPELKWEAIQRRIQARNGEASDAADSIARARVGRSHFATWVKECCTLLTLLGVPYLESKGEAEALCAFLDLNQVVDGCITNDGDAFLYGARTVYKDLSTTAKRSSVLCYKMEDIKSQLNLSRENLVALAVLLGCDYLPQGVPYVGEKKALELIAAVNHGSLIDRFDEWTKETIGDESLSKIEKSIKWFNGEADTLCPLSSPAANLILTYRKALRDTNFVNRKTLVVQEYLGRKEFEVPSQDSLKTTSPDLPGLLEFCKSNLHWRKEQIHKNVLLLITYWQMTSLLEQEVTAILVQPQRIIKARKEHKVDYYDIEWQNVKLGETWPTTFETAENKELFTRVYPAVVEEFNSEEEAKKAEKKSAEGKRKQNVSMSSTTNTTSRKATPRKRKGSDMGLNGAEGRGTGKPAEGSSAGQLRIDEMWKKGKGRKEPRIEEEKK